jgi:hypothetical protein
MMVNSGCTVFSQPIQQLPEKEFHVRNIAAPFPEDDNLFTCH